MFVVLRVKVEDKTSIIWKVVAEEEWAKAYSKDDNDEYVYRYESWMVRGGRKQSTFKYTGTPQEYLETLTHGEVIEAFEEFGFDLRDEKGEK